MPLVFLLYFVSGAAALVFEAVFLRQLTWLLGSAVTATAAVLALFMGGLALGAALSGPRADRAARPLRLYGLIELGAGLSGALSVALLGWGRPACLAILSAGGGGMGTRLAGYAIAAAALLPPTLCMGATLPVLSRYVVVRPERLAGGLGTLYAINTLGGACGVLLAGFWLFERAGISGAGYAAALGAASVGLGAIALDAGWRGKGEGEHIVEVARAAGTHDDESAGGRARDRHRGQSVRKHRAAGEARTPRSGSDPVSGWEAAEGHPTAVSSAPLVLAAIAIGGGAMLGYEVIWTRLLSLPLRSFSYSFSLMLGLFLVGLVLGSALAARIGARVADPVLWLGGSLAACGAYVAASVLWLPARLAIPLDAAGLASFFGRAVWIASPVVLPPTILSGLVLPLAARALVRDGRRLGGGVGRIYAVNTLGAIGGTLATWLVLLPALGASRALAVLAALHAAAGALLLLRGARAVQPSFGVAAETGPRPKPGGKGPASAPVSRRSRAWPSRALAGLAIVLCAGAIVWPQRGYIAAFLASSPGKEKIADVLYFHEGASDTVAIVRKNYGFLDPDAKSLITNGIAMSATARPIRRYMAAEGHLPALLAPEPRRALVLCLGTGITLAAVAAHPALGAIDAVDLSEGVVRGLPYFAKENGRADQDPRVRLVRQDGRHFLETGGATYDLITLEPPPPVVAGSSHLYSREFYASCAAHMSGGAVIAQWLPLHAQSLASARMTARTFCRAFPFAQLWLPSVRDGVLIGSKRPIALPLGRLRAAYGEERVRASLAASSLETPQALLGTYLLDRDGILAWAGEGDEITDDHPWLEFLPLKGPNMTDREIGSLIGVPQASWEWIGALGQDAELRDRIIEENRALRLYVRAKTEGNDALAAEAAHRSTGTEFFLSTLGCAREQLAALRADPRAGARLEVQTRACETFLDPFESR